MLFLQRQRGGDLVCQMLHCGLLTLAKVVEIVVMPELHHAHEFALSEHRNEQNGTGSNRAVLLSKESAAARVGNRERRAASETGGHSRGDRAFGRFEIDGLGGCSRGVHALEEFRRKIMDVQPNYGRIR